VLIELFNNHLHVLRLGVNEAYPALCLHAFIAGMRTTLPL